MLCAFQSEWWVWQDLNLWPHAYQACALTNWATDPQILQWRTTCCGFLPAINLSLRRWSSRRFPYGYLVTTSPQSSTTPWWTLSRRLSYPLLVQSSPMVWRAVCTRPGNVFTAAFWSAITSDSAFMLSSCREQSELRQLLEISYRSPGCCPL